MEFEEDQLKWNDVLITIGVFVFIGVLIVVGYQLVSLWNFNALNDLNNRTCELAGIPKTQCFCEMDVWGNVICSMKQQSSSVNISSVVIRSN